MKLNDFKKQLRDAASANSLLMPKHDPNQLSTTHSSYRTVLSHEASSSLKRFIDSDDYSVDYYQNLRPGLGNHYCRIIPKDNSHFSIAASGVTAHSNFASTALDSLVVVSGPTQGWHVFGEDSIEIENKVARGDLRYEGPLI